MCAFGAIGGFVSLIIELIELFGTSTEGGADANILRCGITRNSSATR